MFPLLDVHCLPARCAHAAGWSPPRSRCHIGQVNGRGFTQSDRVGQELRCAQQSNHVAQPDPSHPRKLMAFRVITFIFWYSPSRDYWVLLSGNAERCVSMPWRASWFPGELAALCIWMLRFTESPAPLAGPARTTAAVFSRRPLVNEIQRLSRACVSSRSRYGGSTPYPLQSVASWHRCSVTG